MSEGQTMNMNQEVLTALQQFQASLAAFLGQAAAVAPVAAVADQPDPAVEVVKQKKDVVEDATKRVVAPNLVADFIKWFVSSPEEELYSVKRGQWECIQGVKTEEEQRAHVLVFHSKLLTKDKQANASHVIATRPVGAKVCIFNASRITYGAGWSAQKLPQQIAEDAGAVPIPFENVVRKDEGGAGLDLSKLEIVEWTGPEKLLIPPVNQQRWRSNSAFHIVNRHFAGAAVVKVEDKYFLFDADREEIKHFGFNPFFTQLPRPAAGVADAYDALMPQEVKDAIAAGKQVIRQGELFFVPGYQDDVREAMTADNYGKFFFDNICERINLLGQAVYNCANATSLAATKKFLKDCSDHNGGTLPDDSHIVAASVLDQYVAELAVPVGPKQAHAPDAKKTAGITDSYRVPDGSAHSRSHLEHVHAELRTVCKDGSGGGNGAFDIRFEAQIGEEGGAWSRRHVATAVAVLGDKEIYASGTVIHTGREHRPVYLDGWHRVYGNTAMANWTVDGSVD